jgi:hypothetical protein
VRTKYRGKSSDLREESCRRLVKITYEQLHDLQFSLENKMAELVAHAVRLEI